MKLSLAVALLGQAVPTLSKRVHPAVQRDGALSLTTTEDIIKGKSSPQSILEHHDDSRRLRHNRRAKRNLTKTMKNSPSLLKTMVPCDPKSTDADVGILSCGEDHVCQPSSTSSLGGLCTPLESKQQAHNHGRHSILPGKGSRPMANLHPQGTDLEECDPKVDIGILVCGEGRYCQEDEMSGLGGFCLDALNHERRLQYTDLDYYLYYCGAYPPAAPTQFCDCSGVNLASGTGTIACSQNRTALEVQGCDEYTVFNVFSYSFENSALVKINDCYETKTPLAEKICFTYYLANPASDCYTDWNGQRCASCATSAYSTSFNCSNVGGRVGDYWVERLSVFDTCPNSTCTNVCGAGLFIPEANKPKNVTIGNYLLTCRLVSLFEEHQLIFDADCPAYSQAAQASCCAPAPAVVTSAPTVSTGSAPPVPAPVTPVPAPVTAVPAPVTAVPAPVTGTIAPSVATAPETPGPSKGSGKGGSKKSKKEKDTADDSDTAESKLPKSDVLRLRSMI